jgi:peptidoglycan/xylan/chitin deacetylase (PgdA/CDA1 family)
LRRFRVLSLTELDAELSHPNEKKKPAAVITFDDGFVNNLLAAEILATYHLPCTIFITTVAIGREKSLWTLGKPNELRSWINGGPSILAINVRKHFNQSGIL